MDESEYWHELEYRICHELSGMSKTELRGLWCDGLNPVTFDSDGHRTRIRGRAWMVRGNDQEEWMFHLWFGRNIRSWEDVDWATLLPSDVMTGWMSVDIRHRVLALHPEDAYPDRHPS